MNTLYLNNSGSRWIHVDDKGNRDSITLETASGKEVTRKVKYWESFGNFATACISYKGKLVKVFTDSKLED